MIRLLNSPRIGDPFPLALSHGSEQSLMMARRTALKLADPRHNNIVGRTISIWGRAYAAAPRLTMRVDPGVPHSSRS
jgi:hypothetical protein